MIKSNHRLVRIAEVALVLVIGFGAALYQSGWALHQERVLHRPLPQPWLSDAKLLKLAAFELVVLAVIAIIGRLRGWSFAAFGWRVSWMTTSVGFALFLIGFLADRLLPIGFHFRGNLSWPVLLPAMFINAFFEETLEVGYVFRAFGSFSTWLALAVSAGLRATLHLYAGPPAVLAILGGGILYGLAYWRWKSLWPLFLAHLALDLLVLAPLLGS